MFDLHNITLYNVPCIVYVVFKGGGAEHFLQTHGCTARQTHSEGGAPLKIGPGVHG